MKILRIIGNVRKETRINRRDFSKHSLMLGMGVLTGFPKDSKARALNQPMNYYREPPKNLPVRKFDVVIAGAGTATPYSGQFRAQSRNLLKKPD